MESFRGSYLYPALILLVALASTISLEVFRRTISQDAIQKLISNRNQLYFTTTSQLLIDAYLFILSIAFDGNPYTGLMLLFSWSLRFFYSAHFILPLSMRLK